MHSVVRLMVIAFITFAAAMADAAPLGISLAADPANPQHPTMGDKVQFHGVISNTGNTPLEGLVAWISLVEIDPGHEQPMDLEDWSAQKAVTGRRLEPGHTLDTVWPMRLIQNGDYRVFVNVTSRDQNIVYSSATIQFHVTQKPVVESHRILPVALGVPLLLLGLIAYGHLQNRR